MTASDHEKGARDLYEEARAKAREAFPIGCETLVRRCTLEMLESAVRLARAQAGYPAAGEP